MITQPPAATSDRDSVMDLEEAVMGIIVNAGQSRSCCFEALRCAKAGDFAQAEERLKQADEAAKAAHATQTKLIEADEGEGKTPMTLVMVHAQDHLMTSLLARELITEMIALYQRVPNPS